MTILSRFGDGRDEEVGERRAKSSFSTLSPSTSSSLTIELRSPQICDKNHGNRDF
ncbi:hypothetical protein [Nostoc sp. FACHB-133]|uniref:hypothetical protein n=1 Tax=Nostoc sp. FACHB-133 TaxID=2692835 RepID=UPI0016896F54|nr:hypothetical protein [Nostoc sp. FACHB-133]MBD2523444.1 hypothetical protein [Nostoc sp. FACHB-133]